MTTFASAGFHHVGLVTARASTAVAFYRDLLGFAIAGRTVNADDPETWELWFETGDGGPGSLLAVSERPRLRRGRWGVGGIHHVAFGTSDETTLLMWKRRLEDAGVQVSGPIDRGYFVSLYFADPDGQILEIATHGPGYDIDEPMNALGRTLIRPPEERLPDGRDADFGARTHPEPVPEVTPGMRLSGIHHVTGITDDLAVASSFYVDGLGLPVVKKTVNQDDGTAQHWFWARWDGRSVAPHSAITHFGWPGSDYRARDGVGQTSRVAFRTRGGPDDLLAWKRHLEERDLEVTEVESRVYRSFVRFRSPDGLLHELAVGHPTGSDAEDLVLPAEFEPRRAEIRAALSPLETDP